MKQKKYSPKFSIFCLDNIHFYANFVQTIEIVDKLIVRFHLVKRKSNNLSTC